MFEVNSRTKSSLVWMAILIVCAGWATYGIFGWGQTGLGVMIVLSIVLVGGALVLLRGRRAGEPVRH